MSKLCSLPWCRKPIPSRRQCKHFPEDRPSQLAWLDALDAGTWFSIPQETLATGLVVCNDHFDSKGNVRRRYDAPPPEIKVEPIDDFSDSDKSEDDARFPFPFDNYYSPPKHSRHSSNRVESSKEIRINIIRGKRRAERDEDHDTSDDDEADPTPQCSVKLHKTGLVSIDPEKLSKFTEDAINSSSRKRKSSDQPVQRMSLSLSQKMKVISLIDKGVKRSQISKQMGLKRSAVWSILKCREKIELAFQEGSPGGIRKIRKGAFDDVTQAAYAWYQNVKSQNLFVNTKVLQTMSENIAKELGRTDFKCSGGWMEKFKKKYNIRFGQSPKMVSKNSPPSGSDEDFINKTGVSNRQNAKTEAKNLINRSETEAKNDTHAEPDGFMDMLYDEGSSNSPSDIDDPRNSLEKLKSWVLSRGTCPQKVRNALGTIESFISEQI